MWCFCCFDMPTLNKTYLSTFLGLGKTIFGSSMRSFILQGCMFVFVFIQAYFCPTGFPYRMIFVSFNSNRTGATSVARTAYPEFTPVFCGVRVGQILVICVMFCRSLLVLLLFSFGHCIVCRLISSNFSHRYLYI